MLKKSLYAQIPIVLGLKNLPETVALPSYLGLLSEQSRHSLPPGTQVTDLFDAIGEGNRTMLILGQPGSGKTIALLQLAQVLLNRATEDYSQRIPVVLNLSSWAQEKNTIVNWLVQELKVHYGVSEKIGIGKVWVEQQELLLLLDGLDEIRNERDRAACVEAINTFQQQYPTEIVVCCRIQDYKLLKTQLHFRRAVYLKNLTPFQIRDYLTKLGSEVSGLRALLTRNRDLQKLARSSLMLNIMVLTYQGVNADDIPEISLTTFRKQQLFDAYVDRMFRGSKWAAHQILPIQGSKWAAHQILPIQQEELYSRQQARYWLVWLAKQMVEQSRTVFLIERLQPDLLKGSDRVWYRINIGLLFGLGFGPGLGLLFGVGFEGLRLIGLIGFLIFGLSIGLSVGLSSELKQIRLVEALNWNWRIYEDERMRLWVLIGIAVGLNHGQTAGLLGGLLAGLSAVVGLGLINKLQIIEVSARTKPNQGILRSAKNFLLSGLIYGLIGGAMGGVFASLNFSSLDGLIDRPIDRLFLGLIGGLVGGLIVGLFNGLIQYGGLTCIQHFVLRCLLYRRSIIPWNYARFLNWAGDKLFLQRVGGGYIFVHRLLMEHFAQMDLDERRS